MKRKAKLVHLTHHACLAAGLGEGLYGRMYEEGKDTWNGNRYRQRYGWRAPHDVTYGRCQYAGATSILTTDLDAVTCTTCASNRETREWLFEQASARWINDTDKHYYEERAELWCDDEEIKMRAWLLCCRHVGAPCPVSKREAIKRLRAERAREVYRSVAIATLSNRVAEHIMTTDALAQALAKMDPADRKLMRGAIERAKEADALLEKAAKLNASIEAMAKQAAKRIRASALVSLPEVAA